MYHGRTAYIVGKGPSLLRLTADHIGRGPVITLNHAILRVRPLNLPNEIYAFQKDGCRMHGPVNFTPAGPGHACEDESSEMVDLCPPEIGLFSTAESPHCKEDYPNRVVLDVESLGLPWSTPSAPVATKLAIAWGVAEIVYLCHDAYTSGDLRRVANDGETIVTEPDGGYAAAGRLAQQIASDAGVQARWVTP